MTSSKIIESLLYAKIKKNRTFIIKRTILDLFIKNRAHYLYAQPSNANTVLHIFGAQTEYQTLFEM